ncbi:MAG: DUF4180 domain-containing protein [Clostridiales bacterium]|jgi:hypothetical protein|nr:DUF4180 domain-containing protein [Clostridiales bacterium]
MKYRVLDDDKNIVQVDMDEKIADAQAALDLIASVFYETNSNRLVLNKSCLTDDFFVLRTGLAGEVLQKFINYRVKVSFVGDYSDYTSKSLKDFIYESNNGNDIFFVSTIEEAVKKLKNAT